MLLDTMAHAFQSGEWESSWLLGLLQVFFYICILNNTFICVLLYLGAGAVFNAATGMNIYAAVM